MTDIQRIDFAAVITMLLPGTSEPVVLKVTLRPSDLVATRQGEYKALGDCTLRELQQFAESLESEIWRSHGNMSLIDMVLEPGARISFSIDEGQAGSGIDASLLLEHSVLLPQDDEEPVSRREGISGSEPGPPEEEIQERVDTGEEEPAGQFFDDIPDAVAVGESRELKPVDVPGPKADNQIIDVKNAELVPGDLPYALPVGDKRLRILGRRRPLNHPTWTAVDILINEDAFRDAQQHALSSPEREVAGVLIGPEPELRADGRFVVHVSDSIVAEHTKMHGASVTYTPESWRFVTDRLVELYPDDSAMIVGWYHTHPGFGIFLSGMDRFIHDNFFTQIWHVALVLDPLARKSGFFCWDRARSRVDQYEFPWPKWARGSW